VALVAAEVRWAAADPADLGRIAPRPGAVAPVGPVVVAEQTAPGQVDPEVAVLGPAALRRLAL
jgi:hypothetical protein